jgi:opacity protein-like surface antigen
MMKRMWLQGTGFALACAFVAGFLAPAVAEAQIVRVTRGEPRQSLVFHLGYFAPFGEDARVDDDTILRTLEGHIFSIGDFNGVTIGADWVFPLGEWLDGSVGVGFYRRGVPAFHRTHVHPDGREIEQDFRLRLVPMTAVVRFLPAGRGGAIEPYVGGGLALVNWRYSEVGEFVDLDPFPPEIFFNRYVASGNQLGGVILAGLRAPVADVWLLGGEVRYQRAVGDTDAINTGMLGNRIDLGGWSANFTLGIRF